MKKFWSIVATIVLVIVLGISILPVKTTAANTTFTNQKCGDGTYASLDANGVLTISGTGNTWDFRVEGDIYSATYGDAPWANCKDAINKVVFTEKVTYIGAEAFCGCINLKEVTFNESMQRIGNFVFMNCSNLTTVNWSTGLTSIGQQAFASTGFVEVRVPDGVSFIDACVFEGCIKLENAYIGSLTTDSFIIGNSVFRGCSKLESITVSEDHFALMSIDGVLYNAEKDFNSVKYPSGLQDYPSGKKTTQYTLPETVINIRDMSITSNPYLETVILHNNVRSIRMVFNDMQNLKNLTIPASVEEVMEVGRGCESLEWLKNESSCDISLIPSYPGWKWFDENENEIIAIKAKSTAYCKKVQQEMDPVDPVTPPAEPPVEPPTSDNSTEEPPSSDSNNTPSTDSGNTPPSSGGNATPPTTEAPPAKEDDSSAETPVIPEEPTTEDALNETDKIIDEFKEQAEENIKDIELIIDQPTIVDKALFESISQMEKDVVIGVVDANNRLQYSWTFSKNVIKNTDVSIDLNISFEVEKRTEIEDIIGNKNSMYMEFSHSGELAGASTINMYVGDTYSDGEKLYLYYYDEEVKEVLMVGDKTIEVKDGYVAYTITHCSIYFMDTEKFDVSLDSASLKDANVSVKDLVINNGQYEVVVEEPEIEEATKEESTTASKEDVTEEDESNEGTTISSIDNDSKKEGKSPKWIILIVGVVVVGAVAAAVVVVNKKKQN